MQRYERLDSHVCNDHESIPFLSMLAALSADLRINMLADVVLVKWGVVMLLRVRKSLAFKLTHLRAQ